MKGVRFNFDMFEIFYNFFVRYLYSLNVLSERRFSIFVGDFFYFWRVLDVRMFFFILSKYVFF